MVLCLLAVTESAMAQMRCGQNLIVVGDLAARVLEVCGEPHAIQYEFGGDLWIYNFGPTEFLKILTIRDGEVRRIQTGDYGFPEEERGPPANINP